MTKSRLKLENLESEIVKSQEDEARKTKIAEIKEQINNLQGELEKITEEDKELNFEEIGILSFIKYYDRFYEKMSMQDNNVSYGECRIIKVSSENLTVCFTADYCSGRIILVVPIKELKEKGYVHFEKERIFIVDTINKYEYLKEILDTIFKAQKRGLLGDIEFYNKQVAEYTERIENSKKSLKLFDDIPYDYVSRFVNFIDFPLGIRTNNKEKMLENLPRVYRIGE